VKFFIIMGLFAHSLFAQMVTHKMILSAYTDVDVATKSLHKARALFKQEDQLKRIKQVNHLRLEMEILEPYTMVVLKPIATIELQNRLHLLLQSSFPQAFITAETQKSRYTRIPDVKKTVAKEQKLLKTEKHLPTLKENTIKQSNEKIKSYWNHLSSEWVALLLLAFAGLLLVARSARQMSKIKSLQEEMVKYQNRVEHEVLDMEKEHV